MAQEQLGQRIRNVIFDFGGVLVRWQPREIIAAYYADDELRARVGQEIFGHPDWIEMDRGTLREEDAAARFAARTGRPVQEMRGLLQHVKDSLTPMPESLEIVRDLHRRGIALYGLSNMSADTFVHLRARYDHWNLFKGIVISGEVRMLKPDAEIFEHLCNTHGLVPAQTVFIDDHLPNIESARGLGFRTIHFNGPGQCAAALQAMLTGERH